MPVSWSRKSQKPEGPEKTKAEARPPGPDEKAVKAIKVALKRLGHRKPKVRFTAVHQLRNMKSSSDEVTTALIGGLKDPADRVRLEAARALYELAGESPQVQEALAQAAANESNSLYRNVFLERPRPQAPVEVATPQPTAARPLA